MFWLFDYSSFQGDFQASNRLFILSIESTSHKLAHTGYYIPKVEIKDYNVIIDRRHLFDQPIKNYLKTYDNICNWSRIW